MNSPLPYIGGKSKLADRIVKMVPEHKTYCEVFAGALWVFFRKEPSRWEVINDLDSDLITFYRVLQNHLEEFLRQFKWLLSSREWFEDWKGQLNGRGLTDIQRAARYYYVQRHAFAGRPKNPSFGSHPQKLPKINLLRLEEELSAIHLRLLGVTIENLDWRTCLNRCDRQETFFFLDPPYWERKDYKFNLDPSDYSEMANILGGIAGKFLLTIDDRPETRQIFTRFNVQPVEVRYTAGGLAQKVGRELLITNY